MSKNKNSILTLGVVFILIVLLMIAGIKNGDINAQMLVSQILGFVIIFAFLIFFSTSLR